MFEINPFYRILKTTSNTKIDSKWQRVPHIYHSVGKAVPSNIRIA